MKNRLAFVSGFCTFVITGLFISALALPAPQPKAAPVRPAKPTLRISKPAPQPVAIPTPAPVETTSVAPPSAPSYRAGLSALDIIAGVNGARLNTGLPILAHSALLDQSAYAKAVNMCLGDYWAHDSPSGRTPWYFIRAVGYSYTYAGENLAYGYWSAPVTVTAWLASAEHYANIMSTQYTEIGAASISCAYYQGEANQIITVNHFGAR
jgi:uncharacterized protein YkwD